MNTLAESNGVDAADTRAPLPPHTKQLRAGMRRATWIEPSTLARGRRLGFPLAVLSVTALSFDGLLIKLASGAGASPAMAVIVTYAAATFTMLLAFVAVLIADRMGYRRSPMREWMRAPTALGLRHVYFATLVSAALNFCFTLGYAFTSAANVLAFAALAPTWTAGLSWVWLRIPLPRRTLAAVIVGLAGSVLVVIGVQLDFEATGGGDLAVLGMICAIGTGVFMALKLTSFQSAAILAPGTPMLLSHLLSLALNFALGWLFLLSLHPAGEPLLPERPIALLFLVINGVCCNAGARAGIVVACSLISATEVSLMSQLTGLLGPVFTFLVLAERPSSYTIGGGLVIIVAVIANEVTAIVWPSKKVQRRIQTLSLMSIEQSMLGVQQRGDGTRTRRTASPSVNVTKEHAASNAERDVERPRVGLVDVVLVVPGAQK
jgi:drug/metabolite transporter (DMT)-like permease